MNQKSFSVIEGNSTIEKVDRSSHNENPRLHTLKVINGGKEKLDELFFKLITRPGTFEHEEFEHLCDVTFKDRLEPGEAFDLATERLKSSRSHGDGLEVNLLLSIFYCDEAEIERLSSILDRRNKLGLTLLDFESV